MNDQDLLGKRSQPNEEREQTNENTWKNSGGASPSRKRDQKALEKEFSGYPQITAQTITNLKGKGITSLFPIQQSCFRPIFDNKDIIGRDLTGSGKTLAFALPLIERFRRDKLLSTR